MATIVDLVFKAAPLTAQPINLVFNESEGGPSLDRTIAGQGVLPALSGACVAVRVVVLSGAGELPALSGQSIFGGASIIVGDGALPSLSGSSVVVYNSDTQRPVVGGVVDRFQNGTDIVASLVDRMQDGAAMRAPLVEHWQDATPIRASVVGRWQDARRLGAVLAVRYQQALKVRAAVSDRFIDAQRARLSVTTGYQQGLKTRGGFVARYQDTLKRRGVVVDRFQQGLHAGADVLQGNGPAVKTSASLASRYQEAIRPRIGLWFRPPVIPTEPCYVPSTDLVFVMPWSADTGLVFVCERHGGGPGPDPEPSLVVVPVRRIYTVINSAQLRRVDGNVLIRHTGMTLDIDVDSWTWSFTARVPGMALADLEPTGGQPVEVEATINGVPYRAIVEGMTRDRTFGRSDLSISGRGRAAVLDAPYSPSTMTFGNPTGARSAQQLANDVLQINGVPMGWDVDTGWKPEDWSVPAGVWSHQGSYITALNAIASAAGAYVQPHRTDRRLDFLLRYPVAPWAWSSVTPDFELPSAVVQKEGIAWQDKAAFNRVFVRGVSAGVIGQVTREGTAGDIEAPMVVDPLITTAAAARQRALPVLADVGRQALVSLRLPVLEETGIIPPGKFVRYVDNGVTRIGIVRSTNAAIERADKKLTIWQTIGVETHV